MRGVSEVAIDPLVDKSDIVEKYAKPYLFNRTLNVTSLHSGILRHGYETLRKDVVKRKYTE